MTTKLADTRGAASVRDSAHAVFDHSQVGMAVLDSAGALLQTNPALRRLLGLAPDALAGRSLASLVDAAHHDMWVSTVEALVAEGTPTRVDLRLRAPDDTERWARVHLSRAADDDAGPSPIVGTFEEVTDEKKTAAEAQATGRRMQQLVDRANDIIFNTDLEGRFTWVNPTASRMMKRPTDELLGMSFLELVRPDYRDDAGRFYQHQVRHRIPSTYYEFPAVTAGGDVLWLGQYVQLIVEGDQIANIQAVARNITARKQAEDALRASEERVRAVVSTAPIVLWAADRGGVFTLCEGHGLKGLGLEPWAVSGRKVMEVFTDASIAGYLSRALEGETFQTEVTLGGRVFDSWYSPLRDANRVIKGIIGVAVDITDHVRLSERLRDAEKMESIGRLAGGVVHDFNNQLTVVLGFAEMLQQSFDETDPRADDVLQIIRGGRRAAALTEQLLDFGRKQLRRQTVLDLNAVLTKLEPLLRHTIREDVHLDTELVPGLGSVTADEVQIERVIMNLALNSRDAMPSGGRLTIRTANVTPDEAGVRDHPPLTSRPYAMVAVTDTGDGIDATTQAHLFEPFFTTKKQGKGTGMGLASTYGIIKQSGGFIEVASEVGRGSTFTFYLPSAGTPVFHPTPVTAATAPSGRAETTLSVEDVRTGDPARVTGRQA